jgi:regulator of ribonuclease activity A
MQPQPTSDVLDELGDGASVCELPLQDFGGPRAFAGPAATVRCFEDNSLVRRRLEEPGDGRVLVVDGGGSLRCALVGDMLAAIGAESGWAGVVIHGCVRDVAALREVSLGIKALGSNPRRSGKTGAGELDVPVELGGAVFRPGDLVYADEDGVVVVPVDGGVGGPDSTLTSL